MAGSPHGSGAALAVQAGDVVQPKLAFPHFPPGLVVRRRLLDLLSAGVEQRVTLISAGAGWGKSMLAAQWAAMGTAPYPVAWLSLDSYDNDPVVFWSGLLAATRGAGVALDGRLGGLALRHPFGPTQLQRTLSGLAELSQPLVLVLDDLHEVRNPDVLDGIAAMLRHPSPLRLILLSRSDPRLPLHRLAVEGQLREIRAAQLAFTAAEAAQLLAGAGVELPADLQRTVVERTEGWATGLRLAAMFATGTGHAERLAEFTGDDRTVTAYLAGEVLATLPAERRRFLLRTSVVDRLCGDLADTLSGGRGGQRELEALEQANAFVVSLGPGHVWFRYHPLLADMLRHQLLLDEPELIPVLHSRAARWFAARGDALEAVRHAVRARDWDLVGEMVTTVAAMRAVTAERHAFAALLAEIPVTALSSTAELRACSVVKRFIARDYAGMAQDVAQARVMLGEREPAARQPTELLIELGDMALARVQGDMPAVIATARGLLDRLPRTGAGVLPAAAQYEAPALSNLGLALLWSARAGEAEPCLLAAESASRDAGVELPLLNTLGYRGLLAVERGDLRTAQSVAGEALELAELRGWTELAQAIAVHLALALRHLERNELEDARRRLDAGLAAQRNDPETGLFFALKAAEARLLLVSGQLDRARAALAEQPATGRGHGPPVLVRSWQAIAEAEIDLARGRPGAARDRLQPLVDQAGSGAERVSAGMARVQLALGDARRAEAILAGLRHSDDPVVAAEAWLTSALLANRSRADHLARTSLDRAVALAEPTGIRRPFVVQREPRLDAMLRRRLQLGESDGRFVATLLGEIPGPDRRPEPPTPPGGPLTDRERIVLAHLASLRTQTEIAAQLHISVNTVKAHVRSVHRKLGVTRRRDAVDRARDLGLL